MNKTLPLQGVQYFLCGGQTGNSNRKILRNKRSFLQLCVIGLYCLKINDVGEGNVNVKSIKEYCLISIFLKLRFWIKVYKIENRVKLYWALNQFERALDLKHLLFEIQIEIIMKKKCFKLFCILYVKAAVLYLIFVKFYFKFNNTIFFFQRCFALLLQDVRLIFLGNHKFNLDDFL